MPIDDFLEFEDDDTEENTEPVAEAPALDVPETLRERPAPVEDDDDVIDIGDVIDITEPHNVVPAVYADDMDDYYDDVEDDRTGAIVTIQLDVNPATINDGDIPQFGIDVFTGGLGDVFGEQFVEFMDSQAGEGTWDIRFRISPDAPSFDMAPALRSAGRALIRPRLENGEITGDVVRAFTSCEYTYN